MGSSGHWPESALPGQESIRLVLNASVFQMSGPPAKWPGPWPFPNHVWEFPFGSLMLESSLGFVIEYLRHILTSPCFSLHIGNMAKWHKPLYRAVAGSVG